MSGDEILVYGASGHAKVVCDVVEQQGRYRIALLLDDDPARAGTRWAGYPVYGATETLARAEIRRGLVAIGANRVRRRVAEQLTAAGVDLVRAVHPAVQVGRGVQIGAGSVVMPGAVLNADARIGANCIVNTGVRVDHDCVIGDHVHLGPGSVLCGGVRVGDGALVGAGATLIPGVDIGAGATVGAGAVVLEAVAEGVTVVGNPGRVLEGVRG